MAATTTPGACGLRLRLRDEPVDDLAGEDRGDVLDAGGIEPVEEDPRTQQLHDRLAAVHPDHHQHAAVVVGRRVDQNVVGADVGQGRFVALQQRPHPGRIRDAIVRRDHHRVNVAVSQRSWSFITLPVALSGSASRNSHRARHLEARHPIPAPGDQFVGRRRPGTLATHDKRLAHLAEPLVGNADHRRLRDGRVARAESPRSRPGRR